MIIVRLTGGTGNQLFQYAIGRALSARDGQRLLLDTTFYRDGAFRTYSLDRWHVQAEIAGDWRIRVARGTGLRKICQLFLWPPIRIVEERSASSDLEALRRARNVYLRGFWQSERYFAHAADILRADLRLRDGLTARRKETERAILAGPAAVSIHVRRTDYLTNPRAIEILGALPAEWYRAALGRMIDHVPDAAFFVFSDDPEWAKANLSSARPMTFLTPETDGRDEQDMFLMSRCRHHVIANSTFGWWGAWLNPRPDKRVIAPRTWFRVPNFDNVNIVPQGWERL